jgi:hypothetical protein
MRWSTLGVGDGDVLCKCIGLKMVGGGLSNDSFWCVSDE